MTAQLPPQAGTIHHLLGRDLYLRRAQQPNRAVGRVRWAGRETPRHAIVFIHGFGGHATDTWTHLPEYAGYVKALASSDLFFYAYDSLTVRVADNALLFAEFLTALTSDPLGSLYDGDRESWMQTRKELQYETVTIVGHSAGAVVSRLALLDLHDSSPLSGALERVTLVYYAPAHRGADIVALVEEVAKSSGSTVVAGAVGYFKATNPAVMDLAKGSDCLRSLRQRTEHALSNSRLASKDPFRAQLCLHATYEPIVDPTKFCEDLERIPIDATTHRTVCKPDSEFDPRFALFLKTLAERRITLAKLDVASRVPGASADSSSAPASAKGKQKKGAKEGGAGKKGRERPPQEL